MKTISYTETQKQFILNLAADMLPENCESPLKCHNRATLDYYYKKYSLSEKKLFECSSLINEFNEYFLKLMNIGFYLSENAPNKFKDLKEYQDSKVIPVYSGASSNSIYDQPYKNYNFRAVHDFHHLKLNVDFSYQGEAKSISSHYGKLKFWLLNNVDNEADRLLIKKIFLADTIGQVEYYYKTKKFLDNQRIFVISYVNSFTLDQLENMLEC